MQHYKKIGLASLSVLAATLLAACNVDEASLQTLSKYEPLTIVHSQGEEAQAFYEEVAEAAGVEADISYVEQEALITYEVEKLDIVIAPHSIEPDCNSSYMLSRPEIREWCLRNGKVKIEPDCNSGRFRNSAYCKAKRAKELDLTPLCQSSWLRNPLDVCIDFGEGVDLDEGIPVNWAFRGVFTRSEAFASELSTISAGDVLGLAQTGNLLVGWCGTPWRKRWPIPNPSPWLEYLTEVAETELSVDEADLLLSHSSQLLDTLERTELVPLMNEGLEPIIEVTRAYVLEEANQDAAIAFLDTLLQNEMQLGAFEEMGALPVTKGALAEVGERGLAPLVEHALETIR